MKNTVNMLRIWHVFFVMSFVICALFYCQRVYAVPADSTPREIYQTNGDKITISSRGDEYLHWEEDKNGYIISYNQGDKNWYYSKIEGNRIVPSNEIVSDDENNNDGDGIHLFGSSRITYEDIKSLRGPHSKNNNEGISLFTATLPSNEIATQNQPKKPMTNQELLLLLIEFDDVSMKNSSEFWYNQYFSDSKSIAQYYEDMSNGLRIFIPATTTAIESFYIDKVQYDGKDWRINDIEWVTKGFPITVTSDYNGVIKVHFHMNYPEESKYLESYIFGRALITMALKAVKQSNIYDFDGFSENKQVISIVAGIESSFNLSYEQHSMWGHSYNFDRTVIGEEWEDKYPEGYEYSDDEQYQFDKLTYSMYGEIYNDNGDTVTMGIACHELGHLLGLPDLYETIGDGEGISAYSLMAYGSWGALKDLHETKGSTPVALDAWSKIFLGYIEPIEYDWFNFDRVNIHSAGDIGVGENSQYNVFRLNNSKEYSKQYFLIENRQDQGWDQGMRYWFDKPFKGGAVIMQIDENVKFDSRLNNIAKHRMIDIVGSAGGEANKPYFYATDTDRDNMTPDTTMRPNSKFHAEDAPPPTSRNKPSKIHFYAKSNSSENMIVEFGEDVDIKEDCDVNFLKILRRRLGKTEYDEIKKSEVSKITELSLIEKNIYDLDAIKYFRGLKKLYCYDNKFSKLDVSSNLDLEILDCSYNENMTELDISRNKKLKELDCNTASLNSLDVSNNPNLQNIMCYYNNLSELDIRNNTELEELDCSENNLSVLNVFNNPKLTALDCTYNNFNSIDDIQGWRDIGLIENKTFWFDPQN